MRAYASPELLLRCADAAGYGAVPLIDDGEAVRSKRSAVRRHPDMWRALLAFILVLV